MPYLIRTPSDPRSFLTNNPVIYMDARSWGWPVESRPYNDYWCKTVRDEEMEMGESFRRNEELEKIWGEEVQRRRLVEDTKANDLEWTDDELPNDRKIRVIRHKPTPDASPLEIQPRKAVNELDGEVGHLSSGGSLIHGWD